MLEPDWSWEVMEVRKVVSVEVGEEGAPQSMGTNSRCDVEVREAVGVEM